MLLRTRNSPDFARIGSARSMSQSTPESFPPEVVNKLKTYVYRLIDPRNGETFYIGKGTGNRVFSHIRAEIEEDDELDNKLKRIWDIRLHGFEVAHVIHRHGMDDHTAFEVEAALIDAYPGLTKLVVLLRYLRWLCGEELGTACPQRRQRPHQQAKGVCSCSGTVRHRYCCGSIPP